MDKTYSFEPEIIEKIKTGAKNTGLSESQFITACIEFFFYKNNYLYYNKFVRRGL